VTDRETEKRIPRSGAELNVLMPLPEPSKLERIGLGAPDRDRKSQTRCKRPRKPKPPVGQAHLWVRNPRERFIPVVKAGIRRHIRLAREVEIVDPVPHQANRQKRIDAEIRSQPPRSRDLELGDDQVLDVPVRLWILRLVVGDVLDVELRARNRSGDVPCSGFRGK